MSEHTKGTEMKPTKFLEIPYDDHATIRAFKEIARHLHVTDGGCIESWGDGKRVMQLRHPCRRNAVGAAIIFSSGDTNLLGDPFFYRNYFISLKDARIALKNIKSQPTAYAPRSRG